MVNGRLNLSISATLSAILVQKCSGKSLMYDSFAFFSVDVLGFTRIVMSACSRKVFWFRGCNAIADSVAMDRPKRRGRR